MAPFQNAGERETEKREETANLLRRKECGAGCLSADSLCLEEKHLRTSPCPEGHNKLIFPPYEHFQSFGQTRDVKWPHKFGKKQQLSNLMESVQRETTRCTINDERARKNTRA